MSEYESSDPAKAGLELWWAVEMGGGKHSEKVAKVKAMVKEWGGHGEVINYGFPGKDYSTPLWQAVVNEYDDIVKILLKAKAIDVNKAPTGGWANGKSPLDIARENNDIKIINLLEEKGAKTKGGSKKRKSTNNSKKSTKKSKKQNKTQKTKSK
jgi:hypothetical protein